MFNSKSTCIFNRYSIYILLLVVPFLTGCDALGSGDDDPEPIVEVGVIAWDAEAGATGPEASILPDGFTVLDAPDEVQAGTPFEVTVTTLALNGCYERDREDIEQQDEVIEITPYDRDPSAGSGDSCPDVVGALDSTVELQFDTPGEALIRLNGQRVIGNDFSNRDDTVIEHDVTVVE